MSEPAPRRVVALEVVEAVEKVVAILKPFGHVTRGIILAGALTIVRRTGGVDESWLLGVLRMRKSVRKLVDEARERREASGGG